MPELNLTTNMHGQVNRIDTHWSLIWPNKLQKLLITNLINCLLIVVIDSGHIGMNDALSLKCTCDCNSSFICCSRCRFKRYLRTQ